VHASIGKIKSTVYILLLLIASSVILIGCSSIQYQREPSTTEVVEKMRAETDAKNRELIDKLQKGGYVIFMRHTRTKWEQKDVVPFEYYDCSKQRNLDDQGRSDAVKIGEAFRALDIPVGTVLSSPFCRTRDTAELTFGRYDIEMDLRRWPNAETPQDEETILRIRKRMDELVAQMPPEGENIVLVSHSDYLKYRLNMKLLAEGHMAIFKSDGNGSSELVGMIEPEELFRLY